MGSKQWVIAGLVGLYAQVVTLLGFSGAAMAAVDGSRPPAPALGPARGRLAERWRQSLCCQRWAAS